MAVRSDFVLGGLGDSIQFVLWLLYRLLQKKIISFGEMLICLTMTPSAVIFLLRSLCNPSKTFDCHSVCIEVFEEMFTES